MKHNINRILLVVLVLLLAMVACSPTDTEPTTSIPTKTEGNGATGKVYKVGLVFPGVINDLSWNQSLYEGAQRLADSGLIELTYTEQVTPADAERIFRRYAEQGFDLVYGHSAPYKDNILKVAKEFPDVNFAYSAAGDRETLDNLSPFNQPHYEPAYLIGMLAAGVSETGKLAGLGGIETPGAKALFKAFELGAKEINPDVTVEVVYTGSFDDIAKGKASATTLADRGIDFFIANGDGPARGSIEAARDKEVYACGFTMDMSPLAPSAVLASLWWNGEQALRQVIDDLEAGTFRPGKYYHGGVADGIYLPYINPSLASIIPTEVMEKMQARQAEIESGQFEVPFIID